MRCSYQGMPELPEVETVVRQLRSFSLGKEISSIQSIDRKVAPSHLFRAKGRITAISRKGKSIIFHLDAGTNNASLQNGRATTAFLLAHLRMTGYFRPNGTEQAHLAASLRFTDGSWLNFHDVRRFAKMKLIDDLDTEFAKLGPDSLEITASAFVQRLQKYPQSKVKTKLMDQSCLAGMGNIYAQEALYRAGIDPRKRIGQISALRLSKLHAEMQTVLQESIARNGTTVSNFSHLDGKGEFQDFLTVYQQDHCPQGHGLKRIVLGGRGTWFCGKCQK